MTRSSASDSHDCRGIHKYCNRSSLSLSLTLDTTLHCIQISKDSQKAILIGKGGIKLKELGTMAREKLEKVNQNSDYRSLFDFSSELVIRINMLDPLFLFLF